jgi:branched-chain amino acid transport system ATP-binding protein
MTKPLLEVRNVSRRFNGVVANDDVSLSCQRGEIVGLIGPNGAGKSTLFNLIAGALPPSSGTIAFDGQDVTSLAPAQRCARGIARTFQVVRSFESMSVLDNVVVGALVRTAKTRSIGIHRPRPSNRRARPGANAFGKAPAGSRTGTGNRAKAPVAR